MQGTRIKKMLRLAFSLPNFFPLAQISRNLKIIELYSCRERQLATFSEHQGGELSGFVRIEQTALEHRQVAPGNPTDIESSGGRCVGVQMIHKLTMNELAIQMHKLSHIAEWLVSALTHTRLINQLQLHQLS